MTTIAFSADAAIAMLPYISNEETRYYLNGICIYKTTSGIRLVATDGHKLGVMDLDDCFVDGEIAFDGLIYSMKKIEKDLKAKRNEMRWVVIRGLSIQVVEAGTVQEAVEGKGEDITAVHQRAQIDGKFPNYMAIMPNSIDEVHCPVSVQPHLLQEITKSAHDLIKRHRGKSGTHNIVISTTGKGTGPSVVNFFGMPEGLENFMALLMPTSIPETQKPSIGVPAWLRINIS